MDCLPSNQEANDFVSGFMADSTASTRSLSDSERDVEMDVAATQVLVEDDEERVADVAAAQPAVEKVTQKAPALAQAPASPQKSEGEALTAEERFVRAFGTVWALLEARGWQVARGPDTMFCAMPGVQFFNFRPNVNVFDSKEKACWKFIAQAREQPGVEADEAVVWDTLWPIAEQHFGWFTMQCGPETMFVKPGTRFEDFKPNETIFQAKKGAVLQCLADEVGTIELGDSVNGLQVASFEAEKPKPKADAGRAPAHSAPFQTPSPKVPKKLSTPGSSKSKYITPPTKRSIASVPSKSTSAKKKLANSSSSKKGRTLKPTSKAKKAKAVSTPRSTPEKDPNVFVFEGPEFRRVTFGLVYQRLQDRGWYHRSGQFEYDYFSPTYNKDTAVLNVDYFQSNAEFTNYLHSSGLWQQIENELRAEHDEYVAEMRARALERHRKQLEQAAKRKRHVSKMVSAVKSPEAVETARPAAKKAKTAAKKPAAAKKTAGGGGSKLVHEFTSSFRQEAENGQCAITIGKVTKKLVSRGWTYRPGRFEYDYFKPGVANKKMARLNEDYFESVADLEMHLKMTGLWDRLAREIEDDHFAEQEQMAIEMSQEENDRVHKTPMRDTKEEEEEEEEESKESEVSSQSQSQSQSAALSQPPSQSSATPPRLPHPHLKRKASPPPLTSSLSSPGAKKPRSPSINKHEVQALTNEIWANSHEFEFDE